MKTVILRPQAEESQSRSFVPRAARKVLRMTAVFFLYAILLLFLPRFALALDVPARPDGYVTDRAGLLSRGVKSQLEALLHEHELQTSNQVLIVILPTLAGGSIEDFSIRLAEKWKPGQKGKDNGIIFLVAKEDRQMRIEVGYGLEPVLPDSVAGAIIRNIVVPRFRAGRFEEGVVAGTQAILEAIRGEFKNENPQEADDAALGELGRTLIKIFFLTGFLLFCLDLLRYGQYTFVHRLYQERYAFMEWFIRFSILLMVFGGILKLIYYMLLTSRGGYYGSRSGYSSFPGGSSGGGFGGGGGGGFGGGGASGSW